jgi:hypothetical protein
MMRTLRSLAIFGALGLVLPACSVDPYIPTFVAEVFSDPLADGDIGFYPDPPPDGTYTVSQAEATGNVLFGLDVDGTEFRAFLDFPLDGSTGGDAVPSRAAILSADVDLFVNDVALASAVPTLVDLVPFPLTGLTPTDFDSLPITTRAPFDFYRSDLGAYVRIDVTPLMLEAQRLGFADLQLRFLLDFVPDVSGLVEIDDGPASSAPLLTVEFQ